MRGLTEKEKQRKESFDKICEKMKADGYEEKDLTVGVVEANVVGVLLPLPFAALACIVYFHANYLRVGRYHLRHLENSLYVFSGVYHFGSST